MFIFWLILAYAFCVYVGLRLVVPYFGFQKSELPDETPQQLQDVMLRLERETEGQRAFLEGVYQHITKHYYGSRIRTITNFWRAFIEPWRIESGFMPCTGQNHLLRLMLVKSGRFTDDDIRLCAVPFNLFIHQYVQVKVNGAWIDVDPWAAFLGVPLGEKAAYFR